MTFSQLIGVVFVLIAAHLRILSYKISEAEKRIEELERKKGEA